VQVFATEREALDYLAGKICDQAQRENVPVTEVERKMLYFSETGWSLPDIANVNAEFDRDYDQNEYERKVALLIANLTAHHHQNNREAEKYWDAAVERLSDGDYYIQIMLDLARSRGSKRSGLLSYLPAFDQPLVKPKHDFLKLVIAAIATILLAAGITILWGWFAGPGLRAVSGWFFADRFRVKLLILLVLWAVFFAPRLWRVLGLSRLRK